MKIILFGATGYLAGWVYKALITQGHEVYPVVRHENLINCFSGSEEVLVINKLHEVRTEIARISPDVIINMSNYFAKTNSVDDVDNFAEVSVKLVHEICTACAETGARLLHVGSAWQASFDGQNDLSKKSSYALFKGLALNIIRWFKQSYEIDYIILNLFDTYGPGDNRGKIISYLSNNLGSGVPILLSPGEQILELVYVSDVANAICKCVEVFELPRGSVEAQNNHEYWCYPKYSTNLKEIASIMEYTSTKKLDIQWGAFEYREGELFSRIIEDKPLVPGWQQDISLEEGLSRVIFGESH